jgi:pimeloyl-ACP methyl ester carboxylesterase
MVESPGYDDAPGAPSQPAIDALWLAAHDWLAAQPGVAPDRIVGMGRSLGSGPTSALAARRPLAAVVLQSGFASTMRFAQARGVPGALVRDRWDNVQALADFGGPVFASHGRFDDAIPPSHAEALRSLTNVQLEWLDCGHNDCPLDSAAYRTRVLAFLATAGVVPHDDGVVGTR